MNEVRKPKTAKGKRVLLTREPQLVEPTKIALFIRGLTSNFTTNLLMKDLCLLKKPNSIFFNKKNDIRPFENTSNIEFLSKKNDASLFMFSSHNKKRPNNIVIGRTYDYQILDMFEIGIENFISMKEFKTPKITFNIKPMLIFTGEFEEGLYQRFKNLISDFFVGQKLEAVRPTGLDHVIRITALDGIIYFRSYRVNYRKTGAKYPKVELEEIGPRFDMTIRRSKIASDDLYRKATKQPVKGKPRKIKNISKSKLGTTFGRIHMNRQDYQKLQTRKMKGLKKINSKESKVNKQTKTMSKSVNFIPLGSNKRLSQEDGQSKSRKKIRFDNSMTTN